MTQVLEFQVNDLVTWNKEIIDAPDAYPYPYNSTVRRHGYGPFRLLRVQGFPAGLVTQAPYKQMVSIAGDHQWPGHYFTLVQAAA